MGNLHRITGFPSREDMTDNLSSHPVFDMNDGLLLSWKVRDYGRLDFTAGEGRKHGFNRDLEEDWADCLAQSFPVYQGVYPRFIRGRGFSEKWFCLGVHAGVKNTRLLLINREGPVPAWARISPQSRCFTPLIWDDRKDYTDWLEGLAAGDLETLYGLVNWLDESLSGLLGPVRDTLAGIRLEWEASVARGRGTRL